MSTRKRKIIRDARLTDPSISRVARLAGVLRLEKDAYDTARKYVNIFLGDVIQKSLLYVECADKKKLTVPDLLPALEDNNINFFVSQKATVTTKKK